MRSKMLSIQLRQQLFIKDHPSSQLVIILFLAFGSLEFELQYKIQKHIKIYLGLLKSGTYNGPFTGNQLHV